MAVGDEAVVGGGVPDAPADALAGAGEDLVQSLQSLEVFSKLRALL